MLSYQHLLDIGLSPDAETLQMRLAGAAAEMGFGLSSGTHIRGSLASGKATVRAVFNTPADFLEASRSAELGQQDPFLNAVLAKPGCYVYDERFYANAGAGKLWDLISAFGYRHGMAVALHEPGHMETFSFGVDGADALPTSPNQRLELEANVMLVGLHAPEAAKRLWTPAPTIDLGAVTKKEVDALRWAMDGVCVWMTGDKLVYSNPGLVRNQRSAAKKLGGTGPGAVLAARAAFIRSFQG